MIRALLLTGIGLSAFMAVGCTESANGTAAAKPRKVYYAHDTHLGTNLPKAYVDSTPPPDDIPNPTEAAQRPFVNSVASGNGSGPR